MQREVHDSARTLRAARSASSRDLAIGASLVEATVRSAVRAN